MNTEEYKNIEDLIERFFEGKTSNAEEQQLYAFFERQDIPSALLPYKEVFCYFETGIAAECKEMPKLVLPVESKKRKRTLWLIAVSVAASLLLLLFNTVGMKQSVSFNPYEGSYIVRNGVRITDMDQIKPELNATLLRVEQQQEQMKQLLEHANKKYDTTPLAEVDVQKIYRSLLNSLPNEYARDEVKKILKLK